MPRQKKRKSKEEQTIGFELRVLRHSIRYSFSTGSMHSQQPEPVIEDAYLKLDVEVIEPEKYKTRCLNFTIGGDRDIQDCMRWGSNRTFNPSCIGTYDIRGQTGWIYCPVPYNSLLIIAHALSLADTDRIRISGEKPRYGAGKIFRLSIGSKEEE